MLSHDLHRYPLQHCERPAQPTDIASCAAAAEMSRSMQAMSSVLIQSVTGMRLSQQADTVYMPARDGCLCYAYVTGTGQLRQVHAQPGLGV